MRTILKFLIVEIINDAFFMEDLNNDVLSSAVL
jgi:hypothetical protein